DRDFSQDAHAFLGMVVVTAAALWPNLAGRLEHQDADGVDVVVGVQAGVGALHSPVEGGVMSAIAGWVLRLGEGRGDAAGRHATIGVALALVQAGRADQAERR